MSKDEHTVLQNKAQVLLAPKCEQDRAEAILRISKPLRWSSPGKRMRVAKAVQLSAELLRRRKGLTRGNASRNRRDERLVPGTVLRCGDKTGRWWQERGRNARTVWLEVRSKKSRVGKHNSVATARKTNAPHTQLDARVMGSGDTCQRRIDSVPGLGSIGNGETSRCRRRNLQNKARRVVARKRSRS